MLQHAIFLKQSNPEGNPVASPGQSAGRGLRTLHRCRQGLGWGRYFQHARSVSAHGSLRTMDPHEVDLCCLRRAFHDHSIDHPPGCRRLLDPRTNWTTLTNSLTWKWTMAPKGRLLSSTNSGFSTSMLVSRSVDVFFWTW